MSAALAADGMLSGRECLPQFGIGLLHRLHDDRHMVEIVVLAVICHRVLGQPDAGDLEGFAELLRAGGEIDAENPTSIGEMPRPTPYRNGPPLIWSSMQTSSISRSG